jgi:hypothetical protein
LPPFLQKISSRWLLEDWCNCQIHVFHPEYIRENSFICSKISVQFCTSVNYIFVQNSDIYNLCLWLSCLVLRTLCSCSTGYHCLCKVVDPLIDSPCYMYVPWIYWFWICWGRTCRMCTQIFPRVCLLPKCLILFCYALCSVCEYLQLGIKNLPATLELGNIDWIYTLLARGRLERVLLLHVTSADSTHTLHFVNDID